jgi:hypothetical protein
MIMNYIYILCMMGMYVGLCRSVCMCIYIYVYTVCVCMFAYIYRHICIVYSIIYIHVLSNGMPIGPLKYAFLRGNLRRGLKAFRIWTSWPFLLFTNHWLMEVQAFIISQNWHEIRHALPLPEQAPKSTRHAAKGCFTGAPLQATRQRNDRQWLAAIGWSFPSS